ncbi:hypothetical protein L6P55_23910 [Klebsiella pneumoniae]|jgi:hypothetical protein|uniref:Uncharacterized protein n=6 Tax=Yonseivirus TaxID=2843478 RepID=A0A286MMW2_9CAUD|nr:hypothetical protein [Klebsiella pneumoniae]YP_009834138.1 tail terminator [Klebsiella phage KPN N137]YP_009851409.1 tail terminator [Klebsiella phage Soft]YP_009998420.1 tail terminator [Klebsiella phage KPN N98]YP_009998500.1 tail terminator [Klebsiella phage KPN U2874]ASW27492.1 hypothetical protein KPNN54_29 [Klebsiella phage KPN N54]ASW27570.1 putative minor tail protein [Klebsiella phage YMC15/11/N53_KPN_BP]WJJ58662.1 putative portal protein [Klebsiella phage vB_KpnS_MAG26fr]DAG194
MSKRLDVLKALTDFLEGISPDNGYPYDFRGKVYRGRDRFGAEYVAKMPFLSILEAKATDYGKFANEEQTVRMDDWVLLVQGWCADDARNPTDPIYDIVAVVEKRLSMLISKDENGNPEFPGVYRLKGMIATLTLAQPVVRPPEEGLSDTAFFFLPIRVGLKVDIRNP